MLTWGYPCTDSDFSAISCNRGGPGHPFDRTITRRSYGSLRRGYPSIGYPPIGSQRLPLEIPPCRCSRHELNQYQYQHAFLQSQWSVLQSRDFTVFAATNSTPVSIGTINYICKNLCVAGRRGVYTNQNRTIISLGGRLWDTQQRFPVIMVDFQEDALGFPACEATGAVPRARPMSIC